MRSSSPMPQQNRPPRRKMARNRHWRSGLIIVTVAAVILAILFAAGSHFNWKNLLGLSSSATTGTRMMGTDLTTPPATSLPSPSPTPVTNTRITLAAVGDIILHKAVIDGGMSVGQDKSVTYDYTPIFQYVQPILQSASLSLANFEGTMAGPPYSGYPYFCAPDAIADALAKAGIKVAWTANNHTIDRGLDGVIRTARVFQEKGFAVVGTRPDESRPADTVMDVDGIKIGLMAYTFETLGTVSQKALNGILMPAAADPLIDSFNPYRPEAMKRDLEVMIGRAAALKSQGAELICVSLHWGNEYQTRSSAYQRQLAQQLADAGVELIIGHHPHVLQEIEVLTSKTTGKSTLVYYSIGNFLANMDYDTHGTAGKAQDAVIARITLLRTSAGVKVELGEYIPTHVVRVPKGNGLQHLIVPVLPGLSSPSSFQTNAKEMEAAAQRISAILGDSKGNQAVVVRQAEK